jgi:hypothetical protein
MGVAGDPNWVIELPSCSLLELEISSMIFAVTCPLAIKFSSSRPAWICLVTMLLPSIFCDRRNYQA